MARRWHDNEDAGDLDMMNEADASEFFSETPEGESARDRWAQRYDDLNGAPENDLDR